MDTGQPGLHGPVVVCPAVVELSRDPESAVIQLHLMEGLIVLEWTLNLDFAIQKFALNVTNVTLKLQNTCKALFCFQTTSIVHKIIHMRLIVAADAASTI